MKLIDINIRRSLTMIGSWQLEITCDTPMGECKATTYFEDLGGFLTAVKESVTFFAVRMGRISSKDANGRLVTRDIAPNPEGPVR